jgi:hypothetical protein
VTRLSTETLQTKSVDPLAWLEGRWVGEEGDQLIEEHWSAVQGDTLMGMFRFVRAGEPRFYEFMTVGVEGQEVVLRIKHFNPGLTGWEEKDEAVTYALVQVDFGQAVFYKRGAAQPNWLIYRREGDALSAHFEGAEGEIEGGRFEFRRAAPPTAGSPDR